MVPVRQLGVPMGLRPHMGLCPQWGCIPVSVPLTLMGL